MIIQMSWEMRRVRAKARTEVKTEKKKKKLMKMAVYQMVDRRMMRCRNLKKSIEIFKLWNSMIFLSQKL